MKRKKGLQDRVFKIFLHFKEVILKPTHVTRIDTHVLIHVFSTVM